MCSIGCAFHLFIVFSLFPKLLIEYRYSFRTVEHQGIILSKSLYFRYVYNVPISTDIVSDIDLSMECGHKLTFALLFHFSIKIELCGGRLTTVIMYYYAVSNASILCNVMINCLTEEAFEH